MRVLPVPANDSCCSRNRATSETTAELPNTLRRITAGILGGWFQLTVDLCQSKKRVGRMNT
jgi:hypothetical protein